VILCLAVLVIVPASDRHTHTDGRTDTHTTTTAYTALAQRRAVRMCYQEKLPRKSVVIECCNKCGPKMYRNMTGDA